MSQRRDPVLVLALLIAAAAFALVALVAWRGHPRRRFRATLKQIRDLPEHVGERLHR